MSVTVGEGAGVRELVAEGEAVARGDEAVVGEGAGVTEPVDVGDGDGDGDNASVGDELDVGEGVGARTVLDAPEVGVTLVCPVVGITEGVSTEGDEDGDNNDEGGGEDIEDNEAGG